jgi:hypothetical protein
MRCIREIGVKFSTLGWKGGKILCQVVLSSFREKIFSYQKNAGSFRRNDFE